ncbi:MAG: RNA methyltransferase [Oscillospiraceae bacterium]|nr:RNA methyltransferase [Oscillospiraceae bacterium]
MEFEKITSRQNAAVKHLRALSRDKAYRKECGEFVCDGEKLLSEAVSSNCEITYIITSEEAAGRIPTVSGARCFVAPQDVIDSITSLKNAQSVIFACRLPEIRAKEINRAIILDSLQDTGNIGTIIRTADAFGIDAVIVDGCADVYNPKTIRSAMGSLFRVAIIEGELSDIIPRLRADGMKVFASELYGETKNITDVSFDRACVVIGNEGNGVRREISKLCDASVIIPMQGETESLNAAVAASIFMYKMSER